MLFYTSCFKNLLLTEGIVHIAKKTYFLDWATSFFRCVFYHLRHGRGRERKNTGGSKLGFRDPLVHFEVEGSRNFGLGYVSQNSRFYHVLSVSVVPSVSVESVIKPVMLW